MISISETDGGYEVASQSYVHIREPDQGDPDGPGAVYSELCHRGTGGADPCSHGLGRVRVVRLWIAREA